jgi:hypothetical protein
LEDLDVEDYVILKRILKKWDGTGPGTGRAFGSLNAGARVNLWVSQNDSFTTC